MCAMETIIVQKEKKGRARDKSIESLSLQYRVIVTVICMVTLPVIRR